MLLPGRVELWALGDVLGNLLRAGVSGTLSLVEATGRRAGTSHHVHLVGGLPAAVLSDGPRLGEVLEQRGAAPQRAIDAAVRRQEDGDRRLVGELLSELVVARHDEIAEGMRAQTQARVDRLFSLGEARLQFRATALGDGMLASLWRAARTAPVLQPKDYLHGRPRRRTGPPADAFLRDADAGLFGLTARSSKSEIKQAFRRLVHQHHPDRATDEQDRQRRNALVARLASAYARLTTSAR